MLTDERLLRGFPFQPATILAPMEGLTHPALRERIAGLGALGLVCTEFVRIHARTPLDRVGAVVLRAPGVPLSVQVMGADPDDLATATRTLVEAGADVVDLNVGCPTRRAVAGGVGAGLLRDPRRLGEVLAAMRAATPGLLSAKLRAGFDEADRAIELGRVLVDAGADFVTVHPRLRTDHFRGVADWRIIGALVRELPVPVVGNGDVWYAADALRMRRETGCAAVMIGRGALRNPWIFRQIAELERGVDPFRPTGADLVDHLATLRPLLEAASTSRRPRPAGALKEHLSYLGRALRDDGVFLRRALRLPDADAILALADRELGSLDSDAFDLDARGRDPLERSGGGEHLVPAGAAQSASNTTSSR